MSASISAAVDHTNARSIDEVNSLPDVVFLTNSAGHVPRAFRSRAQCARLDGRGVLEGRNAFLAESFAGPADAGPALSPGD